MPRGTRSSGPVGYAEDQVVNRKGPVSAPATSQASVIPHDNPQAPANQQALAQPSASYMQFGNEPLFGFTQQQLDARFALEQRQLEAEIAAIEARTIRENKESRARISAIQSGAGAAAALQNPVDEEKPVGEIIPAALRVASRYPGIPKAEIARIFANKFRPENLYKLRNLKGHVEKNREVNGPMKQGRANGTLHNYGCTWDIWSESFINYCMIMVDFFGIPFPTLHRALLLYYTKICKLSKIYEWQTAVLPLAIDYHTEITTGNHVDVDAWTLPQDWIDEYCLPKNVLAVFPTSKKRGAAGTLES